VLVALGPFLAYGALLRAGVFEPVPALPAWITAPWVSGRNVKDGLGALGTLVGCDPRAVESVLIGQGIEPPSAHYPGLEAGLVALAPVVVALALGLVSRVAWREREAHREVAALRGKGPAGPAVLGLLFLAVSVGLYLLQGSSPNVSSVRYLVPVWVALPGLLAVGIGSIPGRLRWAALALLVGPWSLAQWAICQDIDRPATTRALAVEVERLGARGVVATTPLALTVANLTHGRVGALEYQPLWPRLSRRYIDRFDPDGPVVCLTDRRFPWAIRGAGAWAPEQDLRRHLISLAGQYPGRVRQVQGLGPFEIWEANLPLKAVLAREPVVTP
jgi:hypothetical protein